MIMMIMMTMMMIMIMMIMIMTHQELIDSSGVFVWSWLEDGEAEASAADGCQDECLGDGYNQDEDGDGDDDGDDEGGGDDEHGEVGECLLRGDDHNVKDVVNFECLS